jgi:hypothetical protein
MSNRVVRIRILGIGSVSSSGPAVFTTRKLPAVAYAGEGTVVSLSDQLSSEISVFGSMGSDSTSTFTVLSTAVTRGLLMSRGKVPVREADGNQPVRMIGYVPPTKGPVWLKVPDPTVFDIGGFYRIQNSVFKITDNVGYLIGERTWGCRNIPIGMTQQGVGNEPLGSVVYDLNGGNPLGGCEQLPVVIETLEIDGSDVEVIFRGYVNKVSNDTSNGQQNLIKVDCSSMMAYIKNAPFIPAWGPVTANATREAGRLYQTGGNADVIQTELTTPWADTVYGRRWDPLTSVDGDTAVNLWQIRDEGKGGISVPQPYHEDVNVVRVLNQIAMEFDGTLNGAASNNKYAMFFNGGYYDTLGIGPVLDLDVDASSHIRQGGVNGTNSRAWAANPRQQSATIKGENCIESNNFTTLIIDLLLGTHDADLDFRTGARSATESAWLPYPTVNLSDLIDLASLDALAEGLTVPDVVEIQTELLVLNTSGFRSVLPYEHTSTKTVGDVLDGILKRLGAYMVYDKGKFYFGTWSGKRGTPTFVNDGALSDPSIKLTFDHSTCIMRVKAKYCTAVEQDAVTYEVPYLNVDLAAAGLGKEMSLSHWQALNANPDDPEWGTSKLMSNAFGIIMRYSQSAARVDVTLRDSVKDLAVGQQVALTTQYIVNSDGEMGVSALAGYVLKAARSWNTPTTAYTIILPGYVSPTNKVSAWSCSGVVEDVPGGDFIQIEEHAYTPLSFLYVSGPTTDANAFELTKDLIGSWYQVQLLDQYGTLKYQGALVGVDVPGNRLELPGFDAYASPGDIIVLAPATDFTNPQLAAIWDVFLGDRSAQVNGSTVYSKKWVP